MRRPWLGPLIIVALLASAWPAAAGKRVKPPVPAPAPPVFVPAAHPLVHWIREEVGRQAKRKQDSVAAEWVKSLATFYGDPAALPQWVRATGYTTQAQVVIAGLAEAGEWGLDPAAYTVPPLEPRATAQELAAAELALSLAVTRYYWHARGGRVIPAELSLWLDQKPRPVDAAKAVSDLGASADPRRDLAARHPTHPQFEALRLAYLGLAEADGSDRKLMEKLRINLERWRWLARDLGALHIWNNLPEFETRVVRNGEIIHSERIVIGTTSTQTPVFTGWMTHIIFHPEWRLPESIKISTLLAKLRGGDTSVLRRRGLRIHDGEKEIAPKSIKWAEVDIRDVPIVQRSGASNPLGQLKFMFPNKHDVYMHDTPAKHLFENEVRAYSHGCIRVRNPQRLAEVILREAKGWSPADVAWQMRQPTTRLDLETPIPVYNTYMTIVAAADGSLRILPDIYGHDRRIGEALAGRPAKQIAASDPALALKRKNEELVKAADGAAMVTGALGPPGKLTALPPPKTPFQLFWFSSPPPKPVASKPAPRTVAKRKPAVAQKRLATGKPVR